MVRNLTLSFLGGALIGGGSVWLWFAGPAPLEQRVADEGGTPAIEESVSVDNQPAGLSVSVDSVTLTASGWVAIHEDQDGAPGNILGAQRFDAGVHRGTVELLRGTVPGGTYYAMLHRDNGDGAFSPASDAPAMGSDGSVIMTAFAALTSGND